MPFLHKPKKRKPKTKGTGTGSMVGQAARAYKAMTMDALGKPESADPIWAEWKRLSPSQTKSRARIKKAFYPGRGRPPKR
tara:strand:+ start:308 stop:547 length:240 start_codon:yes stop_codon:yes gene_type:complete